MARKRDRERRPARRAEPIEPRRRLLVVAEGDVTEREYMNGFVSKCRNPLVSFDFVGDAGVPMTLVGRAKQLADAAVEAAQREQDDYLAFDEVWCLFDRDEHPHVGEAREMARANGLKVAMSNPCFELWLVLHLRDNPGMQHRHAMQRILQDLMPGAQLKHIDFEQLIAGYEQAFLRAERIKREAREAGDALANPSTEVFQLTDSIDDEGRLRRASARDRRDQESRAKASASAQAAFELAERQQREASVAETLDAERDDSDG